MNVQGVPNSTKGYGGNPPPPSRRNGKFCWGIFLLGGGNLNGSGFDHSNLFQS